MSLADAGSVDAETRPAGTPDTQQTNADNGSAAKSDASPFAGLQDEGTRTWLEKKGYKSVDDLAKAALHQESLIGSSVKPPPDDAPQTEWDKFYSKLGRPEKPDAYEFKRPEGLPEELPYDENLASGFKSWAHSAGLNTRQAQTLHDQFASFQAEQVKAQYAALNKDVEDAANTLEKQWGPKDSVGFKEQHQAANQVLKNLGLVESFTRKGIILPKGELTDASLALAFAAIAKAAPALAKIDDKQGFDAKASGSSGPNPFKEPKNISEISRLAATDLPMARQLAKEAGVNPDQWLPKR